MSLATCWPPCSLRWAAQLRARAHPNVEALAERGCAEFARETCFFKSLATVAGSSQRIQQALEQRHKHMQGDVRTLNRSAHGDADVLMRSIADDLTANSEASTRCTRPSASLQNAIPQCTCRAARRAHVRRYQAALPPGRGPAARAHCPCNLLRVGYSARSAARAVAAHAAGCLPLLQARRRRRASAGSSSPAALAMSTPGASTRGLAVN